ncbi:MAG: pre-peptidase C-terminal domain-containing protein [Candidatus Tectomicrobia bacterium]|uniref:Pre-peptidase C-terminal domain-containing protein n=1 Tax=Tectimicrobiota bacterium TaxID=2528274 RepID=A0A932FXX1_UNCTE|nr:pre-peptidase C-terminal domain-containing protein [Candidatus Tectomicrobia bacterium]
MRWIPHALLLIGLLGSGGNDPAYALSERALEGKERLSQLTQRALRRFSASLEERPGTAGPRKGPAAGRPVALKIEGDPQTGLLRKVYGPLSGSSSQAPATIARRFLGSHRDLFLSEGDPSDLEPYWESESPAGYHVRFRQLYQGIPVYGGYISVHLNRDGQVRLVSNGYQPIQRPLGGPLPPERSGKRGNGPLKQQVSPPGGENISAKAAFTIAWNHLRVQGNLRGESTTVKVLYPTKGEPRLAWQVSFPSRDPLGDWRILVDASTGKILAARNRLQFVEGRGRVFDPNPVATLGDEGAFLTDKDDSGDAVPDEAYSEIMLREIDPSGLLKGPYVDTGLTSDRVREPSLNFVYKRNHPGFEEVMAYFHLDRYQRYIQETLGFKEVNNRVQMVNARAGDFANAYYSPMTQEIAFGLEGVDFAEDADVILHEYGHSIQDNQVPGFGESAEAGAMGEGFSDYIAASFLEKSSFDETCLAEWVSRGFSPPVNCLRRVDGLREDGIKKHYPEDLVGEVHGDGEIWSGALWEIRRQLGPIAADQLIMESNFLLDPDDNFRAGALALLEADAMRNGGANQEFITKVFEEMGILGPSVLPPDRFEENDAFSEPREIELSFEEKQLTLDAPGDDDFYLFRLAQEGKVVIHLDFVNSRGDLDLSLFDEEGNIVGISDSTGNEEEITADNLTPGTYILRVSGFLGATNIYQMSVVQEEPGSRWLLPDRLEENDSLDAPVSIQLPFRDPDLTIDGVGDDDFYRFVLKEDSRITIDLSFTHARGDLDLQLFAYDAKKSLWKEKASSRSNLNLESIGNLDLLPGEYRVRVAGFKKAMNFYTLSVAASPLVSGNIIIKRASKNGGNGVGPGEDKFTNNATVSVEVSTKNATQVRFTSVDPEDLKIPEKERKWSGWSKIAAGKPLRWNLPKGDGEKTVWVQFSNNKKQISAIGRDTIILDATPPTGGAQILDLRGNDVTLSLSAEDATSGVAEMRISADPLKDKETGWQPFKTSGSWTLNAGGDVKAVYVQYRDQAGNISKPIKATPPK